MKFDIDDFCFHHEPLFEGFPLNDSALLRDCAQLRTEPAGKVIYRRGSYSRGVYILKKGKVKISQRAQSGKEQIIYIFRRGEIFGYRPLLCDEPHPVTATTLESSSFSFIPRVNFLKAIESYPSFARFLLTHLSHEFTVWMNMINRLGRSPVKERIILTLLILNEKYKKIGKEHLPTVINLSRENIAAFAGTTVETLVRMLRVLKDEQLLVTEGRRIMILDSGKLEKLINEPV